MEVVTPGFPQALRLAAYVHILNGCNGWQKVFNNIYKYPKAALWPYEQYTWETRWNELSTLALSR
jgi:hypothetical protein